MVAPVHDIVTLHEVLPSASAQPPLPLHFPVLPQGAESGQKVGSRGVPPGPMLLHTPGSIGTRQLWQGPVQAVSQQTPSLEQCPLPQSVSAAHAVPLGSVAPQRLVVCKQVWPVTQSAFFVHVVRQEGLLVSHTNG